MGEDEVLLNSYQIFLSSGVSCWENLVKSYTGQDCFHSHFLTKKTLFFVIMEKKDL